MIRRANVAALLPRAGATATSVSVRASAVPTVAQRTYLNPLDPLWSMVMCLFCTSAFASWGNSLHSVARLGLFRHNMWIDNPYVQDPSKTWTYVGAFIGFNVYWFIVGPMKYRHSDMEKWAKRVGPF